MVAKIDLPEGTEPQQDRVWKLRPELGEAAAHMAEAAIYKSILPDRLKEAVRYKLAQINGCLICQDWRDTAFGDESYAEIESFSSSNRFTTREKLAIEFAELFALNHEALDDDFFKLLKQQFTSAEILDLTFYTGRFMAFGRLVHVLGLDDTCELQLPWKTAATEAALSIG